MRDLPRHHETFGRISAVVSASAFVNRDDDEVREAFETLCLLGRRHAAPILRELAQRRPLLRRARTLAVGKLAAARLQKLTGEKL